MIFSKLQGGYWPNFSLVASKCAGLVDAEANHSNDFTAFLAGNTPAKNGDVRPTTVKSVKRASIKDAAPVTKFQFVDDYEIKEVEAITHVDNDFYIYQLEAIAGTLVAELDYMTTRSNEAIAKLNGRKFEIKAEIDRMQNAKNYKASKGMQESVQ